jgi:hypothetical protein
MKFTLLELLVPQQPLVKSGCGLDSIYSEFTERTLHAR